MSSLGFTPGSSRTLRARPPPRAKEETAPSKPNVNTIFVTRAISAEGSGLVPLRWSQALIGLNLLLFGVHTAVVVTTLMADIRFPITVYQTRLRDDVNANFTCIYDFAKRDGERFCTVDAYTASGNSTPTADCESIVDDFNNGVGALPSTDEGGSPLLAAYNLERLFGDVDEGGARATRYVIVAIEAITALFHLTYAATFVRILRERREGLAATTMEHLLARGGMPGRWHEYALTAGLMSIFISASGNVFDVYALLGAALSTFGLMYIGGMIEHTLAEGLSSTAIVLLYVPGMALFAVTWVPLIRQLWLDVFRISCRTWETDTLFSCAEPTCFGRQVPIAIFVLVLLVLFGCFALIAVGKVYFVGGWSRPFDELLVEIRRCTTADRTRWVLPVYWLLGSLVQAFGYVGFLLFVGPAVAVGRVLADCLLGVLPYEIARETRCPPTLPIAIHGLYAAETAYAIASATAKLFLAIFFLVSFGSRDW